MRIYTKAGDKGDTSLYGGAKVRKSNSKIEVLGTLDELNSHLGLVISKLEKMDDIGKILVSLQNNLFDIGAEVAGAQTSKISEDLTLEVEERIDKYGEELPELKSFILPGGSEAAADLFVARSICRRLERRLVALKDVNPEILKYINRLSDLLFVLARVINKRLARLPDGQGFEETRWEG